MPLSWPYKDPDEVLDYELDWSTHLDTGDTISSSTWTVPAGLTKNSDTNGDSTTTIWLQGGTEGTTYTLLNEIVTAGGRTEQQSVTLSVRSK